MLPGAAEAVSSIALDGLGSVGRGAWPTFYAFLVGLGHDYGVGGEDGEAHISVRPIGKNPLNC